MKIQIFYKIEKTSNGNDWEVSLLGPLKKPFNIIDILDATMIFGKLYPSPIRVPSCFFFVVENETTFLENNSCIRYTIVESIDELSKVNWLTWLTDENIYNEIMSVLRRIKMERKIYEMILCGISGMWLIQDWPYHEKVKKQISVNTVEKLISQVYPKDYFKSCATIYLIVDENKHSIYKYRYTFSSKPEIQVEDNIWAVGDEAFESLNKSLSGVLDPTFKKKKAFLSGTYCEESLALMSKAARFLGYDETICCNSTSGVPSVDARYWRNVYNTILNGDISAVFMFVGKNQSMSTTFGTVERMATSLDIPVYRKEEYENMILEKVFGDQNDTQSDNNSDGDNNGSNGRIKMRDDGSGIYFSH